MSGRTLLLPWILVAAYLAEPKEERSSPASTDRVLGDVLQAFQRTLIPTRSDPSDRQDDPFSVPENRSAVAPPAYGERRTEARTVSASTAMTASTGGSVPEKLAELLKRNCSACHGPNKKYRVVDDFNVADLAALEREGYLVPGKPDQSRVWQRVAKGDMPPPHLRPLAEQERAGLKALIAGYPQEKSRLMDIVDTCKADGRLSVLVGAAEKAALLDQLRAGGPYTILAPTDDAMKELLSQYALLDEANRLELWKLLLNHAMRGKWSAAELQAGRRVRTLLQLELQVEPDDGKLWIMDALVVTRDIPCSNGLVHVIDRVLVPPALLPGKPSRVIETPTGMKLVDLAGGDFTMGSPPGSDPLTQSESPQRTVRISPFFLGQYEVTRGLYLEVMGSDASYDPPRHRREPPPAVQDRPVQHVTWMDAVKFCNALSKAEHYAAYYRIDRIDGKDVVTVPDPNGNGYRLPTEAEWEFACQAGSGSAYCFGDSEAMLDQYAWHNGNVPRSEWGPQPVGQKSPNQWGLFDMHGNVQEWCQDWYGPYAATAATLVDPRGPNDGTEKVYRGGSYFWPPAVCRSASRTGGPVSGDADEDYRHASIGFRVARTSERGKPELPLPIASSARE